MKAITRLCVADYRTGRTNTRMKALLVHGAYHCPECRHALIVRTLIVEPKNGADDYRLWHPDNIACPNAGKLYDAPIVELTEAGA